MEEIKEEILRKIQNQEVTSEEIQHIIDECFEDFMRICVEEGYSYDSIQDYVMQNKEQAKMLARNVCDGRKDDVMEQVSLIFNKMQDDIENKEEKVLPQKFENIEIKDNANTNKILEGIEDALEDSKIHVTRILTARECDDRKIEEIEYNLRSYIHSLQTKKGDDIKETFDIDRRQTIEMIIKEYQEYEQEINKTEDKNNEFREELKVGVPNLEEQREHTKEFLEKENNNNEEIENKGKKLEPPKLL